MQQMACHGGRIAASCPSSSSPFPPALIFQMPPPCQTDDGHLLPPPAAAAALVAPNLHANLAAVPPSMPAKRTASFPVTEAGDDDDLSDEEGSLAGGEKKRRLNAEQVRALERSFELGNKLEPERKAQLARALALRPRQVAIWFQNRRARWKTKQLERDYGALKKQLDAMRTENESLHAHNKKLQSQILALRGRETSEILINLNRETEGSCSNKSDNSSEINLDMSRTPPPAAATESSQMMPYFQTIKAADELQIDHLLRCSNPKIDSSDVSEMGSFSNLLCGINGDQPALWPWPNHHHHHLPQHHHHHHNFNN